MTEQADCVVNGITQGHAADGWLTCPDGDPIVRKCRTHADICITEYREKLCEEWSFLPFAVQP